MSLAALIALAAAQVSAAVLFATRGPDSRPEEVFQSIAAYGGIGGLLLSLAAGLTGIADALRRGALVWGAAIAGTVFVAIWTVGFLVYFGRSALHPFVFSGLVPLTALAYALLVARSSRQRQ